MNNTLEYILKKWNIDPSQSSPIRIKISRFKTFITLLNELEFKTGAEIGVNKGWYSRYLCSIPGLKLYCIDPWLSYPDYVENHHDQNGMDGAYLIAKRRMKGYNCELIRKTSLEAVKDVADNSLDFVFIDGNHSFEFVVDDISAWSKKVRPGGIVAGHDYWNSINERPWTECKTQMERMRLCQVKDVVDAWTKAHQIKPWFVITGDRCPSYFWVKE